MTSAARRYKLPEGAAAVPLVRDASARNTPGDSAAPKQMKGGELTPGETSGDGDMTGRGSRSAFGGPAVGFVEGVPAGDEPLEPAAAGGSEPGETN
jgi:hypothetical protein